jgi:WD40 repeat protein
MGKTTSIKIQIAFLTISLLLIGCDRAVSPAPNLTPLTSVGETDPGAIPAATAPARLTPTRDPGETATPRLKPTTTLTVSQTTIPTEPVIEIGNLFDLSPIHILTGDLDPITAVAFSPDSALIAASAEDGLVRVWDPVDGKLRLTLTGHAGPVRSLAFSPDGSSLATGSDDRNVFIWDLRDGSLKKIIDTALIGKVLNVTYSPDGSLLAIAGHLCYVMVRHTPSGILRRTLKQPECLAKQGGPVDFWGLAFTPDGSSLITGDGQPGGTGGSIQVWDLTSYTDPQLVAGYDLVVRDLSVSPDGDRLAVALVGSSEIWMVDILSGETKEVLSGHEFRVNSVNHAPNGSLLASGGRDATVRLWDAQTGDLLRTLVNPSEAVNSVSFSPDGRLLASGGDDAAVMVWGLP